MIALVIGASGATGKDLIDLLLKDDRFQQIHVFVRKALPIQSNKLQQHIIDFEKPESWKQLLKGDVLYSCLGTTLKDAGSKEAQYKVDYDYQYQFAKAARENGLPTFVLVSAEFASPSSPFFYSKMKGQLELAVRALNFPRLIILKPPMLLRKGSRRKAEVLSAKILLLLNKMGLFSSAKPLDTSLLAQAMINASTIESKGELLISGQSILQYASGNTKPKI